MKTSWKLIALIGAALIHPALASSSSRVDADIKQYDSTVEEWNSTFNQLPAQPKDKAWVKSKLAQMVKVDQYMRNYANTPSEHSYTQAEKTEFQKLFMPRWSKLDSANTADLKELLKLYPWFKVSEFGKQADQNAWLLVQHADLDPTLQKSVLTVLDGLWKTGETSPANYAYLFDRVAASWNDPGKRTLQRYGTQGTCNGPGAWQALPVEDPEHLDARRASVGLGTQAEYLKLVQVYCH